MDKTREETPKSSYMIKVIRMKRSTMGMMGVMDHPDRDWSRSRMMRSREHSVVRNGGWERKIRKTTSSLIKGCPTVLSRVYDRIVIFGVAVAAWFFSWRSVITLARRHPTRGSQNNWHPILCLHNRGIIRSIHPMGTFIFGHLDWWLFLIFYRSSNHIKPSLLVLVEFLRWVFHLQVE